MDGPPNVTLKHLDAIEAQLQLTLVQIQAFRHHLAGSMATPPTPVPTAPKTDDRPERCRDVPRDRCGLVTDDEDARRGIGNFADPHAWQCTGCLHRSDQPAPG